MACKADCVHLLIKDSRYNATPFESDHRDWIDPRALRARDARDNFPRLESRAWMALRAISGDVLDASDLDESHSFFTLDTTSEEKAHLLREKKTNKKATGRWSFECGSNTVSRYALLRSKTYRLDFFEDGAYKIRCKGADRKSLNDISFDTFIFCALGKEKYLNIYSPQSQIRSRKNVMYFDCFTKKIFDATICKRFLMPNPKYTAIYGYHYLAEIRKVWDLLLDLISQIERNELVH